MCVCVYNSLLVFIHRYIHTRTIIYMFVYIYMFALIYACVKAHTLTHPTLERGVENGCRV